MPTSAPGSRQTTHARPAPRAARGFTLIELMVVLAVVAIAAGLISLALPDARARQLEQEGQRLATLLEAARAEARASALAVRWVPTPESREHGFRFEGLPSSSALPQQWLEPGVVAQLDAPLVALSLGPEPLIGAQRVVLVREGVRVAVATDGLAPFAVQGVP